jgi:hypothetical protein
MPRNITLEPGCPLSVGRHGHESRQLGARSRCQHRPAVRTETARNAPNPTRIDPAQNCAGVTATQLCVAETHNTTTVARGTVLAGQPGNEVRPMPGRITGADASIRRVGPGEVC